MRKRISSTLWGLLFIVLGIGIAGDIAGAWNFWQLVEGWWMLIFIIPALFSIIEHGIRIGNTIGLFFGVALFACCQGYLPWVLLYKLLVPAVIILIGLVMVLKNLFHLSMNRVKVPNSMRTEELVVFSGKNLIVTDEFYGIDADSVFGGLTIDLRRARISEDISIDATAVFGGVDIFLPENVTVKISDTSLFGGCSNSRGNHTGAGGPVVYVNAIALFGGVEVK